MRALGLLNGHSGIAAAAVLAVVGFGLTSAQTPTMAASTGMSEIAKLAARGGLDAIDAMLDARSPGIRAPGALTQTKGRRVASLKDAFDPKERVLSGERTRPTDPAAPAIAYELGDFVGPGAVVPQALPSGSPTDASLEPLPQAAWLNPVPGGGGGTPIIVPGGGGGSGGGGGGGSGGGSNGGGGGDTPGVGTAVPEPATWATLMIGFFAIGFSLRGGARRRPNKRAFQ